MLSWIEFENYKALRDCRLALDRITVLVGANGSGKSTVLEALRRLQEAGPRDPRNGTATVKGTLNVQAEQANEWRMGVYCACTVSGGSSADCFGLVWDGEQGRRTLDRFHFRTGLVDGNRLPDPNKPVPLPFKQLLGGIRIFSFQPAAIGAPCQVRAGVVLEPDGKNLAAVLDGLRDECPDRFQAINEALPSWLPEFDQVLFDRPDPGKKGVVLRTRKGGYRVRAENLSDGTRLALCFLTLAYLPEPPPIIGIEEPEHGLHPHLLVQVHDALVRLAYPEQYGEQRDPVQVIATTHSPYFLDLFKDHPEQVVIANKTGLDVSFTRLAEREDLREQLSGSPLGEIWYSGVLGGVPEGS